MDILRVGRPELRARATAVDEAEFGSRGLMALVDRMVGAMRAAPGVGLAAPQIGVAKRVVVLEDTNMPGLDHAQLARVERTPFPLMVLVNPELELLGAATRTFFEACLSVPDYGALVERHHRVRVRAFTPDGEAFELEATGWQARILQHEVDHLDGTLYVDRMLSRSLCCSGELDRWRQAEVSEVRAALGV